MKLGAVSKLSTFFLYTLYSSKNRRAQVNLPKHTLIIQCNLNIDSLLEYLPNFVECLPIFLCLDEPKIFSFKSDQENNIVNVGETVKIICKAEGFPAPNYTIVHNCIKYNGVKIIKSVNIHDGGRYECVAQNNLGTFSANFNLAVKGEVCLEKVFVKCKIHVSAYKIITFITAKIIINAFSQL